MGVIKEFIEYKKAINLIKKISKLNPVWDVRLEEKKGYDNKISKDIIIDVDYFSFQPIDCANILELLIEECVKYNMHFFGEYEKKFKIKVKVK